MHNWCCTSIDRVLARWVVERDSASRTKVFRSVNEARASVPGFTLGNVAIYRSSCRCREQDWGTGSISTKFNSFVTVSSPKTLLRCRGLWLDLSTDLGKTIWRRLKNNNSTFFSPTSYVTSFFLCYVTKVKQFSGKKIISLTFITSRYNCTYLKVTINKTKQNSYIFKRVYEMISCPSYIRGIITSNPSNRKGGGGSGDAKARLKTCAGRCPPPLLYRLEIPASHA